MLDVRRVRVVWLGHNAGRPAMTHPDVSRLAKMATDADLLAQEHDAHCKGAANVRNEALWRMCHEYNLTMPQVAELTGIKLSKIQNTLTRVAKKKANRT